MTKGLATLAQFPHFSVAAAEHRDADPHVVLAYAGGLADLVADLAQPGATPDREGHVDDGLLGVKGRHSRSRNVHRLTSWLGRGGWGSGDSICHLVVVQLARLVAEGGVGAVAMPEGVGASNFIVRFCIS